MIFLIEYDRESGKLITFRSFDEADQTAADRARLEMELDLLRNGVEREVVILEAPNEDACDGPIGDISKTWKNWRKFPSQAA